MTPQEELEYLELLELEAKAGGGPVPAAAAAPAPATEVDKMKAAIMGQNKALGLSTGREYEGAGQLAKDLGVGALRTLDYTGGLARTGVYAVPRAAKAIYEQDPAQAESMQQDLLMALQGQAPTSKEQLEKLGVGELGAVNLPLLGRTTGRGALGLLSDALTAGGASSALRSAAASGSTVASALRAPEAAVESAIKAGGKSMYSSGLKKADLIAEKFGKGEEALSKLLLESGVTGSAKSVAKKAEALADKLLRRQQTILADATSMGAKVDAGKLLKPIQQAAQNMASGKNIQTVKKAAGSFANEVDDIISMGSARPAEEVITQSTSALVDAAGNPIVKDIRSMIPSQAAFTPVEASNIKSQIYNLVGDEAYNQLAKSKTGSKLFKVAGSRLRSGVEKAVAEVSPEMAAELKTVNKNLGTLLTSKKVLASEAGKEVMKNGLTSIDGILLANPAMFVGKKAADLFKTTAFRTNVGSSLYNNPYNYLNTVRTGAINVGNGNE